MSETQLSATTIAQAVRNEPSATFLLGDRTFDIKDLDYDSYIEFCDLARPIITSVADSLEVNNEGGKLDLQFNFLNIDSANLIKLAGKELPRMAWICCKQSDPKIKIEDVKRLGRRPLVMLEVVLKQVKHNEMVKEFADFFPRIASALTELMPAAKEAMEPIPVEQPQSDTE